MTDGFIKVPEVTVAGKDTDCEVVVRGGNDYYRQRVITDPDLTATGTLTNLNDALTVTLDGRANTLFQISHAGWTGTVTLEATCGGGWTAIYGYYAGSGQAKTSHTDLATASTIRCVTAGMTQVRIRLSTVGAGTATVYAVATAATAATGGVFMNIPLPQGENLIGSIGNPEYAVSNNPAAINGKPAELVTILGYRRQWSSITAYGDVCPYLVGGQAKMNTPDVGVTYYVVSTSAQDATGGTGVNRLRITYLDSASVEQTVDASLNGTTPVSIGSGFTFIQMMESWHSTIPEREPVGNLTISSVNGVATEATTMEMIRATQNRSQSARYKIPAGRHGHLIDYHVSIVKLGTGAEQHDTALRATIFNDKGNGLSNTYRLIRGVSLEDGSVFNDDCHYKYLPPLTVIKMSNKSTSAADGNVVKTSFDMLVVDE